MEHRSRFVKLIGIFLGGALLTATAWSAFGARPKFLSNTATSNASTVIEYPMERNASGISVLETAQLMSEIASLYQNEVLQSGAFFAWDFDWEKPWLGAGSSLKESDEFAGQVRTFEIMLWGGFIRSDRMTLPALEFTLCHEFGHFLAGEPKQVFPSETAPHWSSAEGQSDWWAASVCLPKLYRERGLNPEEIETRTLAAGLDFARFAEFHFEKDSKSSLEAEAPETPAATLTLAYPSVQCRLDTVRIGAACARATDAASREALCRRPRCWYVEAKR